jgi:putative hemolysin
VQVGITLVGVIASVFGGATIAEILAGRFEQVPWLAEHAEAAALAVVVAAITFLSLIVGELVPKRIALSNPERIAALVARPMRVVAMFAHPLVAVLTGASNLVLRLFGLHGRNEPGFTEEEIHALVEQGMETGVVPEAEHEMVEGVFRVGDRQVASIMTPRLDVDWIDASADAGAVRDAASSASRDYLLVCDGTIEHVIGVVYSQALLRQCLRGETLALRDALEAPIFVPAGMPILRLLDTLRSAGQRAAVALDEYGGVQGVVTFDDIVEEIFGQLPAASEEEPSIAKEAEGAWIVDGGAPIEDLEQELDLGPVGAEGRRGFRTLGGFLMTRLGRLPVLGDAIVESGFRFEVLHMDGRRVARVRITRIPERSGGGSSEKS